MGEEDEDKPDPPKHPLLIQTEALLATIRGNMNALVVKAPESHINYNDSLIVKQCNQAINEGIDSLIDTYTTEAETLGLGGEEGGEITPLPSAFTSKCGADKWKLIVDGEATEPNDQLHQNVNKKVVSSILDSLVNGAMENDGLREQIARDDANKLWSCESSA